MGAPDLSDIWLYAFYNTERDLVSILGRAVCSDEATAANPLKCDLIHTEDEDWTDYGYASGHVYSDLLTNLASVPKDGCAPVSYTHLTLPTKA